MALQLLQQPRAMRSLNADVLGKDRSDDDVNGYCAPSLIAYSATLDRGVFVVASLNLSRAAHFKTRRFLALLATLSEINNENNFICSLPRRLVDSARQSLEQRAYARLSTQKRAGQKERKGGILLHRQVNRKRCRFFSISSRRRVDARAPRGSKKKKKKSCGLV